MAGNNAQYQVDPDHLDQLAKEWRTQATNLKAIGQAVGELLKRFNSAEIQTLLTRGLLQDFIVMGAEAETRDAMIDATTTADAMDQDATNIETCAKQYRDAEEKAKKHLPKDSGHQPKPQPPHHGGQPPHGPTHPVGGPAPVGGPTPGNGWKTVTWDGGWDGWSPGRHHTRTGAGVIAQPHLDGLSPVRHDIVERALERIQHNIGYSQSAATNGYRDDCSGFVSCAWGLPGPGLTTIGLMESSVSHRITKDELQPGDAMIAGGHTVLFGGWADAAHTKYIGLEDNGSQGTVSQVIPYPYFSRDANDEAAKGTPYLPFRRNGVQ